MTTGELIQSARKKAGLTQRELGERLGITYQTVAQWENNLRNPKYNTLQRIAKALDVHPMDLVVPLDFPPEKIHDAVQIVFHQDQYDKKTINDAWEVLIHAKPIGPAFTKEDFNNPHIAKMDKWLDELEVIGYTFSDDEAQLIEFFSKLNSLGRQKAIERAQELTEIPRYKEEPPVE